MKKISIIFFLITLVTQAQQDTQYTQYMYNTISVNPAYAGSRETLSIIGMHRSQWVGLDGAPATQTFSLHSPVGNNVGIGLSLINDKIGPSSEVIVNVDFSYFLRLNETTQMALGLKAGGNWLDIDFTRLEGGDYYDPRFANNVDKRFNPNIGVGTYIFSEKFYVGLSAPNLLETHHYNNDKVSETYLAQERVHGYLMGGYIYDLSDKLKLKPAFLLKGVAGAPLQVDLSTTIMFNERFTVGAAYRWSSALSGLVGFQITNQLLIGYAYDAETSSIRKHNSGSHELVARFEFLKQQKKDSKEVVSRFY